MEQPAYAYRADSAPPNNYLAWSICSLIFCCLPLGVIATIFSVQSQSAANRGDMAEAQRTAATAKTCNLISMIGGGIVIVIFIILFAGAASHAGHP